MNIHILAMPHTQLTDKYICCAYTQKVIKLCKMLVKEGMGVTVYASEDNETPAKLVTCISKERQAAYGFTTPETYNQMVWEADKPIWLEFNSRAIVALQENVKPGDLIGSFSGLCSQPIANAFPNNPFVELGIGYAGILEKSYHVYESWAWLHTVAGQQSNAYLANGKLYDEVIPNYFDPEDFPYAEKPNDYVLFVGRMIWRKGLQVVADLAARCPNTEFILAGLGATKVGNQIHYDYWTDKDGKVHHQTIQGDNLRYIGTIDAKRRGSLMSHAKALICPTMYIGPFEGVHVEAMMCGTPVLTTPFGVFSESYVDSVQGFKCHTLKEFQNGLNSVGDLDRRAIRKYAQDRYSMDAVAKQYLRYFARLDGLSRGGYNEV